MENSVGNIGYGTYYLMMFAIPLAAGSRFGTRPGTWLKLAAASGFIVTLMAMGFSLLPIVDVASVRGFALKVAAAAAVMNAVGVAIYWDATRRSKSAQA